jgi:hypothetical protein
MNTALRIVLGAELILGVIWTQLAAMAHGAGGLAVVGVFFFVYALYAAFFLFAAWAYWTLPDRRRIAGWIMALPIVFWFLPQVIRSLSGGVLTEQQFLNFLLILLVVAIAVCWVVPQKVAAVIPNFLLGSRLFNWLILLAMIAGWLFLVFAVVYIANDDKSSTAIASGGMALGYAIIFATMYLIGLGLGCFGVSTWAWVSLRSSVEKTTRRLNIAQLVVASPGILIGILSAVWMAGQTNI